MIRRRLPLLTAGTVLLLAAAPAAFADPGLTQTVWHTANLYDDAPTQQDITLEQGYLAQQTPAYSFINTVDGFNYGGNNAYTIGQWFGADAAGPALGDFNGLTYFGFDAAGYIYAATAGTYTFNLGNTFNQIDDAARITVDGNIVAEQNYEGGFSDFQDTITLTAGYHSYDLFYFQTVNGYSLDVAQSGPDGGAIDFVTDIPVPEPAAVVVFGAGLVCLALMRRRSRAAVVAATA